MKITVNEAIPGSDEITREAVQKAMKGLPGFHKSGEDFPRFGAWGDVFQAAFQPIGYGGGSSRGMIGTTSAAEGLPFVVKILDVPKGNKLLSVLREKGWYELNHYQNSQWGTWKFAPEGMRKFKELLKIASSVLSE